MPKKRGKKKQSPPARPASGPLRPKRNRRPVLKKPEPFTPPKDMEELMEQYWLEESAPTASLFEELEIRGAVFPHPDELTDEALPPVLWRMFASLAQMRVFVSSTDHLDDRTLYTLLWKDVLRKEPYWYMADPENSGCHLDLLGGGSEEQILTHLRYYADDETRTHFADDGMTLPDKETPPFNRDRFLPKRGRPVDEGPEFDPKTWKAPKPDQYRR
jgi:hypothetical protein